MEYITEIKKLFPNANKIKSMVEGHNSSVFSFVNENDKYIFKKNNIWPTTESESFFLKMLENTNFVPKLSLVNFDSNYQVMKFIDGKVSWQDYPLENQKLLYRKLGEIISKVHEFDLGNGSGEYKSGFPEFRTNLEFLRDRINWIRQTNKLRVKIPDLDAILNFLEKFLLYNLDDKVVLTHGDLYLENTLHDHQNIFAIIDPGEFRGCSRYIDIGTVHASQARYENGDKHFSAFIEGYNKVLNFELINAFSIFWDLRCYRRLSEENPERFIKWVDKTYEFLLERLEFIGYR
jgi:fructosamine-3-kinase